VPNLTPEEQAQLLRDMMTDPAVFAEAQAAMQRFYDSHEFVITDDADEDDTDEDDTNTSTGESHTEGAANPLRRRERVDPDIQPTQCFVRRDQEPTVSSSTRPPSVWAERVEDMGIWVRNGRSSHPDFPGAIAHGPEVLYPGDPGWDYWNAALAGNDVVGGEEPPPIELFRRA
jgi:hypothetical protein